LAFPACGGDFGGKGGGWNKDSNQEKTDPLVEVVPAWRGSIPTLERSTGRVEARNLADVYAQVSEVAVEVRHDVGDFVEQGDVLLRFKSDELVLGMRSSQLAMQEAELAHSKNELDLAKRRSELERIEKYSNPAGGQASLFSKEAHEAAKLEYDKALNAVETSALALDKARGTVAASALQLGHSDVKAPISGYITERNVRENELVNSGALVFRIADFSVLEVRLDVAEARLSALREPTRAPGVSLLALEEKVSIESAQAALLSITAFPQQRFLGFVDRISPTVDTARGMVVVTVRVIQPRDVDETLHQPLLGQFDRDSRNAVLKTAQAAHDGTSLWLRPGMWVDARVATTHIDNALLVPGAAVMGDTEVIWVVTPDDEKAETGIARSVDISDRRGVSSEGAIEIRPSDRKGRKDHDLQEGALIAVRGQHLLRDGQKVRVRDISK
jgi:RND family efflux transporter MFP subunit